MFHATEAMWRQRLIRPPEHLARQETMVYSARAPWSASWRSGDAADCKSVYTGSIPVLASNILS